MTASGIRFATASERSPANRVRSNPHLIVVQRRLFAPTYQGPGRWVVFDPLSRRQFLAVGGRRYAAGSSGPVSAIGGDGSTWPSWAEGRRHQDVVPDVLGVLAVASGRATRPAELVEAGLLDSLDRVDRLIAAGLLREDDGDDPQPVAGQLLRRYHMATFDYPFHDYFDREWYQKDLQIMEEYKRAWDPPPPLTPRQGPVLELPPVTDHDAVPEVGSATGQLTLRGLAAILRWTFGPTEYRDAPVVGTLIRRTSPSGGSRHPTEVVVLLPTSVERVPAGAYHYCAERHALVAAPAYTARAESLRARCGFLITSRIERAMWRYREMRSFRPIPIDAGHVAETLTLLLGLHGLESAVQAPGTPDHDSFCWVEEPELALVRVGPEADLVAPPSTSLSADDDEALLTNPALYLTAADGRLHAHALWPRRTTVPVGLPELQVLGHCLPSTRGDRNTTPEGVVEAISELPVQRVRELRDHGVLLPRQVAGPFDDRVKMWSRYGWYLSFLAHLDILGAQGERTARPGGPRRVNRLGDLPAGQVLDAMRRRRTTRAFTDRPIERPVLERLLLETTRPAQEEMDALGCPLTVVVAPLAGGHGLDPTQAYRWSLTEQRLEPLQSGIDRDRVRAMTIGQQPISKAAAVVWLLARPPLDDPSVYELALVALGRTGQRLCLFATDVGLGAFMTPAVCDLLTFRTLGLPDAAESLTYAFGLGHRHVQ